MQKAAKLKQTILDTNPLLFLLCIAASAYGLLAVHSATLRKIPEGGFLHRDTLVMAAATALGIAACLVISYIDYEVVFKLWPLVAAVSLGLMFSLFVFGEAASEARSDAISWLKIGGANGISFQPSELVKIGFAITFSVHLTRVAEDINQPKNVALLGIHGMLPIALVILTGDLGSALVFVAMFLGMLYIGGMRLRYFAAAGALAASVLPVLWIKFFSGYQKNRFLAVYYPKGMPESEYASIIYQQQQGLTAIGSGRIWGKGLFRGDYTQGGLVPVNESDMIFSVVGEELGFAGGIAALALLSAIIVLLALSARRARDKTGCLLCYGMAIMIGIQSIINIGMCMKLLPCIGITLPFFSAGGSSNLCVYLGLGLVLSVYRFSRELPPTDFRMIGIHSPFEG